jgi:hypothetical protein
MLVCGLAHGMVFDNRYFPLYQKPFTYPLDSAIHLQVEPFYFTAHHAFGGSPEEGAQHEEVDLFDRGGSYNQVCIDHALQVAGITKESLLHDHFRMRTDIPWDQRGRRESWGFAVNYYQWLDKYWGFGFSTLFMHVISRLDLELDRFSVKGMGSLQELLAINAAMHKLLGLQPGLWEKTAFGDIDFYVRLGTIKEYMYRMKRLDLGWKVGVLIPSAPVATINNPAAVPVGGNGHWGVYTALDVEAELKQNLKVGMFGRLSRRLPKVQCSRLPVCCEPVDDAFRIGESASAYSEPIAYGALVERIRINPGYTVVFSPYITFESLQDGLGFGAQYTVEWHTDDHYDRIRTVNDIPVNFRQLEYFSSWAIEYITLSARYDFGKHKEVRGATPFLILDVDIPFRGIVSKRSSKTYGISLRIETDLW